MNFSQPELISVTHDVESFDCGNEALNSYLKRFALGNSSSGVARTWVTISLEDEQVIGFYSLAAGSVEKARVSERVAKGTPNLPIPLILLARLAVDHRFQRSGIGRGLLADALKRCLAVGDSIGVRDVLVHAKNDSAAQFYEKAGFVPSPTDPLHLMLLMKDLRRTLSSE